MNSYNQENKKEQTTRLTVERYQFGLLWKKDEQKYANNLFYAMGQFKSLKQCLQKGDRIQKPYEYLINTAIESGYVRKTEQD